MLRKILSEHNAQQLTGLQSCSVLSLILAAVIAATDFSNAKVGHL